MNPVPIHHEMESPISHDHIHSQVQFQERDNLPKCQCDFQNLEFGQVQLGCAEMESCFLKQHDSLALTEWLAISGMVKE